MKFMDKIQTTEGEGLVIGGLKGGGVAASVRREGERGPGRNMLFGWCDEHKLAFPWKGQCPRCYPGTVIRVVKD